MDALSSFVIPYPATTRLVPVSAFREQHVTYTKSQGSNVLVAGQYGGSCPLRSLDV